MSRTPRASNDNPDDSTLETALRAAVVQAKKDGELHTASLKTIRTTAEKELGLEGAFFKSDPDWNQKSKDIINAAFVS